MTTDERVYLQEMVEDADEDAIAVLNRVREGDGAPLEEYRWAMAWLDLAPGQKLAAAKGRRAA